MTAPCATSVASVTHRYGKTLALEDVTLDIPGGCMAGLIGPDGVGKSTLLGLVAGVRKLQSGRVVTLGQDLASAQIRQRVIPRIAYMPQGLGKNLYPTLTVRENLDFFGRLFGQPKAERDTRITELLRATGLDPFPDRPVGKLSGGMKQKLGLCCALIHDPDLLILDEPTTGVDPLSRRQFWQLINIMRKRNPGMSVLVATAYMEEAEQFDWLAALYNGSVIATGSPAELMESSGTNMLDHAFIAMLPEAERAGHRDVIVQPLTVSHDQVPAISASGLTRRFGDFTAVENVSFDIYKGEIFGFLGSNGCGKTTTMKMLTGLLEPSEGSSKLFGQPMDGADLDSRRNVGYMSQNFSLYSELTVRQNMVLHARLFAVPQQDIADRVTEMLERFDLEDQADAKPGSLPLGLKQRLQLAVAVIHKPAILILDEPTSGVDPVARDAFWNTLMDLSRRDGVTIFISTHFMNEAERCDRISLMHAGKVLAAGTPADLIEEKGAAKLEDAFVSYLEAAIQSTSGPDSPPLPAQPETGRTLPKSEFGPIPARYGVGLRRLWAYSRRETMELRRDGIRLFFALAGPLILMLTVGYGISFDVEGIDFAVFDQDRTPESRLLADQFTSISYFEEHDPITSASDMDRRMIAGELTVAIEVPPSFGSDLNAGLQPELSIWLDGSMPFRSDTARSYIGGVAQQYGRVYAAEHGQTVSTPFTIEPRFLFNQAFKSVNSFIPTIIMLIMLLIPAINASIGVVREKETGSIANFRATPITSFEFLLGKQLPYVGVSLISAVTLFLMGILLFQVPFKGSLVVFTVGTIIYIFAATAFGMVFSCFTKTQVAAVFATAIFSTIPAINFSGLLVPLSSLSPAAQMVGRAFPPSWFQPIAMGTFTKGLGWAELWVYVLGLVVFYAIFLAVSTVALRKQEA